MQLFSIIIVVETVVLKLQLTKVKQKKQSGLVLQKIRGSYFNYLILMQLLTILIVAETVMLKLQLI